MVAYFRPTTLDEALALKAARPLAILAGGTDIYPARTTRAAWGSMRHADVLDITAIPTLRGITEQEAGWRIGALATWSDLVRAPLPPLFDGLKAAARDVGGVQIQNRGTLAGNICNASPAADGVPPLLTLDAEVEITSTVGTRRVSLVQFIDGYRHTVLRPDEIATAILVPRANGNGNFLKLGARRYLVISIALVAGTLDLDDTGRIRSARLAVGACSAVAQRLHALEADLAGHTPADAAALVRADHLAHLSPIDDVRATGDFRAHAALTLMRDLVASFTASRLRAA